MDDLNDGITALQRVQDDEISRAFHEVFALSSGKRVLFWMLEQCSIYQDAFCGEMGAATNYTLGTQAPGRRLIAKLDQLDPRMYPNLLLAISEIKSADKSAADSADNNRSEEYDVDA